MQNRRGFTIIEMGLALVAFLLLLSLVMIAVNSQRAFRRDVSRTTNMNQLQKALALYVSQFGQYPAAKMCITGEDVVMKDLIEKKLFEAGQTMADPRWRNEIDYCYFYESTGSDYSVRYYLETDRQAAQGYHYLKP